MIQFKEHETGMNNNRICFIHETVSKEKFESETSHNNTIQSFPSVWVLETCTCIKLLHCFKGGVLCQKIHVHTSNSTIENSA